MRDCQICGSGERSVIQERYCDQDMELYECVTCGHRYVDGVHLSQAWFDNYYLTQYQTDDKTYSDARLNSLADCIAGYGVRVALDIGGMDMELVNRLTNRFVRAYPVGVGDKSNEKFYDAVILSHTLEHIYDIDSMMARVRYHLKPDGLLFVEVPIRLEYQETQAYDYHWQHINKFKPSELWNLFGAYGFEVLISKQIEDYREYKVWRIVGRYD